MAVELVQISVLLFVSLAATATLYVLSQSREGPRAIVVPLAARPRRR